MNAMNPACAERNEQNVVKVQGEGMEVTFKQIAGLLARRIVEPVKQLDRAAAEVARQNYAIEVDVNSEDEIGRLAGTFNTMCASIRQAREDLIRQERISTIGRLSGSIVHDLRNPLASIAAGTRMIVKADSPKEKIEIAALIQGSINRMSQLIDNVPANTMANFTNGQNR